MLDPADGDPVTEPEVSVREVRGWLAVRNHAYGRELWAEDVRVGLCPAEAVRLRLA